MDPVHDFPSPHGTKASKLQKRLHKTKPSPVGCCPIGLGYVFPIIDLQRHRLYGFWFL